MSALTKILIVLQLVFSLVCSVLLVLMVSKSENYKALLAADDTQKIALQATLAKEQAARTAADADASKYLDALTTAKNDALKNGAEKDAALSKAEETNLQRQADINRLNSELATLSAAVKTANSSLATRDEELAKLRPQVAELTTKYNEVYRAKNESDNQLRAAEQAIRKLQELLAGGGTGGTGAGGASGAGAAGVTPIGAADQVQPLPTNAAIAASKVNGQISDVALANGRTLIEMPLGTRDGIQVGTRLYVYRANGYVGDATVQTVSQAQSVAVVMSTKTGQTPQKGDYVSTTGQ